jgi:light-regulated signal transduction histidine kinase (bacteriophytochrome)
VAHDLRAPLRSMAGFASLLEMDVASGALDDLPKHTARITQNAARMNALIDGLLAVSRVTHGELKDEPVDFAGLAAEVINEAGPAANVQVSVAPLPVMRGDTSALRQVWANLVSNALKYSARRAVPQVRIGVEVRESEYVFSVSDNGAGFNPAYSQRLFGVFSRLHSTNEFEGTGVGLAVVRKVIERHGGHVWAEGRPDQGATFYFTLPASRNITRPA